MGRLYTWDVKDSWWKKVLECRSLEDMLTSCSDPAKGMQL